MRISMYYIYNIKSYIEIRFINMEELTLLELIQLIYSTYQNLFIQLIRIYLFNLFIQKCILCGYNH